MKHFVCHEQDIPRGTQKEYTVKNIPLLIVHSNEGKLYAVYGYCPHQHAPLCKGVLGGITVADQPGEPFRYEREGEIIRCPWHGFSFDVTTGACLTAPDRLRVKTYPLSNTEGQIYLEL